MKVITIARSYGNSFIRDSQRLKYEPFILGVFRLCFEMKVSSIKSRNAMTIAMSLFL